MKSCTSAPAPKLRLLSRLAAAVAITALAAGCGKVSPVAPSGTTITLSANPTFINSATGTSTITAIVRKPNGTPVASGTEVRFTVDLGTIDPLVKTDSSGIATATLRGDGRLGKATVSALVGGGTTATTLAVNIGGIPPTAKSITLQVEPPEITTAPTTLNLLAVVRDASGGLVDGASVTFSSPVGTLHSKGAPVFTNNGIARDKLDVSETDFSNQAGPFTVTASTPGSDGTLIPATFQVTVNTGQPVAKFHNLPIAKGSFTVQFVNDSTPTTGLTYNWDFGDGQNSQDQNPTHTYGGGGTFAVTLIATNGSGQSSVASHNVTVPGT